MSNLPAGWATVPIGELIALNPKNTAPDGVDAAFMPMNLLGKAYRERPTFQVKPWGEIASSYVHFAEGDVLLAKITPCFENGKAGIAVGLPSGIGAGSSEFFVCRPVDGALLPQWLLAHFKTNEFLQVGAQQMTGSVGHKRVPKGYLVGYELQLPPYPEQKRIAGKLDKLLARIDACRVRLDQVSNHAEQLKQSVLSAARSGALSAAWREANPGGCAWQQTTLGEVARIGTGTTPLRSNPGFYAASGIAWITSAATGLGTISAASEYVTTAAVAAHRLKVYPPGTLLVAMYGEGKTRGQVAELAISATVNQACAAIEVDESVMLRRFAMLMLQANYLAMRELAEGGNQPNLNLAKVRGLGLPLPSLAEQAEICRQAERLLALARAMDKRVQMANRQLQQMVGATLAKAFRGELVPQDPADEPAQAMLDRLRAATRPRGAAAPKPRTRRATSA